MLTKLKKIPSVPKKVATHVYNRRGRYGFVAGTIAGGVALRHLDSETYKEAIAFIELRGLSNEFFAATEFDYQDMV